MRLRETPLRVELLSWFSNIGNAIKGRLPCFSLLFCKSLHSTRWECAETPMIVSSFNGTRIASVVLSEISTNINGLYLPCYD